MRPKQIIVTSGTTIFPVEYKARATSIVATPAGAGNYTISYTTSPLLEPGVTANYAAITAMTAATTAQTVELGPISAIKIVLNSGTSVTVDLVQED